MDNMRRLFFLTASVIEGNETLMRGLQGPRDPQRSQGPTEPDPAQGKSVCFFWSSVLGQHLGAVRVSTKSLSLVVIGTFPQG